MRYLYIGAVDYSAHCLDALCRMKVNITAVMCPTREAAVGNSDYRDLGETARKWGKPVRYFTRIADEAEFIRGESPDVVFVFGLSQLIPSGMLSIPRVGYLGSHPALLPQNRGRHPIIWALANGLEKSGISFFWLDEGADSGDLWAQKGFIITPRDDAGTVYEKVKLASVELLKGHLPELERGIVRRIPQDKTMANSWRKRTAADGQIDWRMSTDRIVDLVRALRPPYVGAHCRYQDRDCKVWNVKSSTMKPAWRGLEPGKVLSVKTETFVIKTGDGAAEVLEHECRPVPRPGDYL